MRSPIPTLGAARPTGSDECGKHHLDELRTGPIAAIQERPSAPAGAALRLGPDSMSSRSAAARRSRVPRVDTSGEPSSCASRRAAAASRRRRSAQSNSARRPHVRHSRSPFSVACRCRAPAGTWRSQVAHANAASAIAGARGTRGCAKACRCIHRLTIAARWAARSRRPAESTAGCRRGAAGCTTRARGTRARGAGSRRPRRRRRSISRSVART